MTTASALSEAKSSTFTKLVNGNFYTKSGNNYSVATTYQDSANYYTLDMTSYYVKDSTTWTAKGYASEGLYYYNEGTYIPTTTYQEGKKDYYKLDEAEARSVTGFGSNGTKTTLDGISNVADYQISNSVIANCFADDLLDTQYVHSSDANHETSYVRFIIFFKIEPDEDYITSYMSLNQSYTDNASSTEILISNSLTMDLTLRSVPKYTEYPEG